MVRVNLLPAAYVLRCRRTRRLRQWIAVGAVVVALQVPAVLALRQMGVQARQLQQGIADAMQQRAVVTTRLAALAVEQAEAQRQLELAERLSRKHRWSELLATIADCVPDTAVLMRVESDPPRSQGSSGVVLAARGPAGQAGTAAEGDHAAGGLLISGMGIDHDAVTAFLRNLNARGRVGRCTLESATRQPFMDGEGVSFTVRMQW